jgi:hypothetical protein
MNFRYVLKVNWWLWACFSFPPIIYFLFHTEQDKAGRFYSGWTTLLEYATKSDWPYSWEVLVPRVLFPLVIGWVAQYFLVMAWNYWNRSRKHILKDSKSS